MYKSVRQFLFYLKFKAVRVPVKKFFVAFYDDYNGILCSLVNRMVIIAYLNSAVGPWDLYRARNLGLYGKTNKNNENSLISNYNTIYK